MRGVGGVFSQFVYPGLAHKKGLAAAKKTPYNVRTPPAVIVGVTNMNCSRKRESVVIGQASKTKHSGVEEYLREK